MSTARDWDLLHIPGRLVKNPTSLAGAYPYGGTELGSCRNVRLDRIVGTAPIQGEEFGTIVEVLYTGELWILSADLRGWDDDVIGLIFPHSATGGTSGRKLAKFSPRSTLVGTLESGSAHEILFVPDDPESRPAIYLANAVVNQGVSEAMGEQMSTVPIDLRQEAVLPLQWLALPTNSGDPCQWGILADITLI